MADVLIALAIEGLAFHFTKPRERREVGAQRVRFELAQQLFAQLADAGFVVRVADVDDLPVAALTTVFDDARQGFDAIDYVRKAALLRAAVHQPDRCAFHQMQDQLSDGARAADACSPDGPDADPSS